MNATFTSALRLTASLWLAGATVAIADPALAAASSDLRPQMMVQVDDLNLLAPAGRATAQRRLRIAARAVCASGDRATDQACLDQAMTAGGRAIDARATGRLAAR